MKTQLELNIRSRGAMSGVLTLGSLDPAFSAAARVVEGEAVVLDLRSVEFVEPSGLCGLAALLEFLIPRSGEVGIALSGRNVPAYLERMDFFRVFGSRVKTNADVAALGERRRGNPGTLQELVNFHSEEEIPDIVNRISKILEYKEYPLRERAAIYATLSEICANAVEHGHSPFGAYAAVQAYQHIVSGGRERRGEEVIVAIADGGVGVRETLSRNPEYAEFTKTDNDALRHALTMGVSGTGELGRGGGLAVVGQISARAKGSLSLRSGSGRVTFYGDRTNSRNVPTFPGTFVRVSLPRKPVSLSAGQPVNKTKS
jgi:anti-sigma regulatory factor (Ser/Thr protein kinase)